MPPSNARRPEQDSARNEYIPSFISKKPFYVTEDDGRPDGPSPIADYLQHQRLQKSQASAAEQRKWYDRGSRLGPAATKFRKGACENCGAMTHKTRDCLSRPRKQGAKWTGKDIAADEVIQQVDLAWDAKRDRWNGYDSREYEKVVDEYNELENMRKRVKVASSEGDGLAKADDGVNGPAAGEKRLDDGTRYEEEAEMGRQQGTSTRNLRIREDTAKYLLNLDLDSAKYDPKTRSMVDAGVVEDAAAALVMEENILKASGDAAAFETAQAHAWEAREHNDAQHLHLQANPTSGEYLRRKNQEELTAKRDEIQKKLLQKYGEQAQPKRDDVRRMAVTESDRFVEYDETGLIKQLRQSSTKSQYPEDILNNNHTSVWGSWWQNFAWGYACCQSTIKNSYCTGSDGLHASE